jgi:hypothetical protein
MGLTQVGGGDLPHADEMKRLAEEDGMRGAEVS